MAHQWIAAVAFIGCVGAGQQMRQPNEGEAPPAATAPLARTQKPAQPGDPLFPELPQIRTMADAREHDGKRAEIHGRYEMTAPELATKAHPVTVVLADGAALLRSYEPIAGELHLKDKSVVVIGIVRLSSLVDANGAVSAGIEGPQLSVEQIVQR